MDRQAFFDALYPKFNTNGNLIEVRPINIKTGVPEKIQRFSRIEDVLGYSDHIDQKNRYHVFFELAELRPNAQNGQEESIARMNFLFSDLDPHKKDAAGKILETYTKEQLMDRINAFPIPPSILVDSGFGYHLYWLLDVPLSDIAMAKALLGKIQERLDGDPKAILATQLLRVPYTKNLKRMDANGPPITAKVVGGTGKRHSIGGVLSAMGITREDLATMIENEPLLKKKKQQNLLSKPVFDGIQFSFKTKPDPLGIKADNFGDLLGLLKRQNILDISNMRGFPIGRNFRCCFHDDHKASANVFVQKDGTYGYHCFGCDASFDIITIYQKVTGKDFCRALVDLADFFGIDYEYSQWIRGQIDKYYRNATIQVNFEKYGYDDLYPNAYKLIQPRIKYLHLMNHYALGNLKNEQYSYDGQAMFFVSYEYFANHFGKGYSVTMDTAKRSINLFCALGLIQKVPISCVPFDIASTAIEATQNTIKRVNAISGKPIMQAEPVNFYVMHETHDRLQLAEERAKRLLASGFKIGKTMNKEFLILSLGQAIADEVYPDRRTVSKNNLSIGARLETTLKELIGQQGYATKEQIVAKTKLSGRLQAGRDKKERELEKFFVHMLAEHNLEYVRATKALMAILGINKSCFVIIPKGVRL